MVLDPVMLRIDNKKQLFIDDLLIESAENICRTWHQPVKQSYNPVLEPDQEWEHVLELTIGGFQVKYDKKYNMFKCWYLDSNPKGVVPGGNECTGVYETNTLYAESDDGVVWRKPLVGKVVDGVKTNIVIKDGYELAFVLDPYEKDEKKRYKGLYVVYTGSDGDNVVAVTSGDGIKWDICAEKPTFGDSPRLEDALEMSYDPMARIYILNTRHYEICNVYRNLNNPVVGQFTPPYYPLDWRRMNKRRIWQAESADCIHWGEPYSVIPYVDGYEELDENFYGMCQYRVGSVIMGLVTTFNYVANHLGVKLVYSRDGKTWEHLNNRKQFLDRGQKGSWDEFMTTMSTVPIEYNGELYFYYGGAVNHHDWWIVGEREGLNVPEAKDRSKVRYCLGLAKLRMDGYTSLDAGVRPGILITRHFISNGTRLVINAKCNKGGSVKAEIVDAYENVITGFGLGECDAFTGDETNHMFTWNGKSEMPPIPSSRAEYPKPEIERWRKIRFYINDAELYSFTMI